MALHESLHAYMLPVMERFGAPCVTQCTYLSVRLALGPNLPLRAGPLRELRLRNTVGALDDDRRAQHRSPVMVDGE